jgi:hypothetical protein
VDTKELETLDPLNYSPGDVNGGLFGPPFRVVHDDLFCLAHIEEEVVISALPTGCLIVVGDQAYRCCIVSKLNDGVGIVAWPRSQGSTGVQEGTKHAAPLRVLSVED